MKSLCIVSSGLAKYGYLFPENKFTIHETVKNETDILFLAPINIFLDICDKELDKAKNIYAYLDDGMWFQDSWHYNLSEKYRVYETGTYLSLLTILDKIFVPLASHKIIMTKWLSEKGFSEKDLDAKIVVTGFLDIQAESLPSLLPPAGGELAPKPPSEKINILIRGYLGGSHKDTDAFEQLINIIELISINNAQNHFCRFYLPYIAGNMDKYRDRLLYERAKNIELIELTPEVIYNLESKYIFDFHLFIDTQNPGIELIELNDKYPSAHPIVPMSLVSMEMLNGYVESSRERFLYNLYDLKEGSEGLVNILLNPKCNPTAYLNQVRDIENKKLIAELLK